MASRKQIITLEDGWRIMETGITKLKNILEGLPEPQFTSEKYMEMYTIIYNLCTQKAPHDYSQQLYDRYGKAFETYINALVLPSLKEKHDEFLLKELSRRWENHKLMIRWLSRFFHYLDRYYVARKSFPTLKDVGKTCFRDLVYQKMNARARDVMLRMIAREREGDKIDRSLLKTVLDLFEAVEGYDEDFEEAMLEETSHYYSMKASNWIVEDSCPSFMVKAEECLQRETERVSHYLFEKSKGKLLEKAQHELLVVHSKQLLGKEESGCSALLRDDKKEDLSRMYRLYSRVPVKEGLEPVALKFQQHVTSEGTMLVKQADEAASNKKAGEKDTVGMPEHLFIKNVIALHDKYLDYVEDSFEKHSIFHKALKEAFEVFCNKEVAGSSTAEVLATFCDNLLKKGGTEKLSDEAIEVMLDKVVKVLAYVNDKDLFGEFCRKKLARRLLFDRSASEELEKSLLQKLKQQWGGKFTSKMQGMITDLTLARETQSKFENSDDQPKRGDVNLSVTVLTTGFWPSYKSADVNLPMEMVKGVERFKSYYQKSMKSRKLTWIHSLGSCHVNGKFGQKTIELIVTTYQACVLLLFNDSEQLTYTQIKEQSNLTDDDLVRLLHSLSCAKYKILNKEPNTKTISPKDSFEFNSKFTDKMRRIKVPLPPVDEKKKVIEDVDKDRRYTIDASLVRIMKSRKVLGHQHLVAECVQQLSKMFKPDIKLIKKRIEDLITRDYLERDSDNPTMYKYLA